MSEVDIRVISDKLELMAREWGKSVTVTGGVYIGDLRVLILDYQGDVLWEVVNPPKALEGFGPLLIWAVTRSYVVFEVRDEPK